MVQIIGLFLLCLFQNDMLTETHIITDPDNPEIFEFSGLSKGIDVYNTLTVMKEVNITNQNFQSTQKGITLNGTVGSKVTNNTFSVPPGISLAEDTYGLLTYGSIGLTVEDNQFQAQEAQYNPFTFGAIFDNTEYGSFVSHVRNNFFDSRLNPATQFIGSNNRLYTNCNAYDDCDLDWHLATDAILPDQGICDPADADLALRTHWHYVNEIGSTIGYNNYHIINDNLAFTLNLNIDNSVQSDPIYGGTPLPYVTGNVNVQQCDPLDPFFQNMSCTVPIPIEGAGMADCNNENDIEQRIYNFLRYNQRDSLLALLHCIDTEWAIRLLVGTYVDEGLYEHALDELQNLPNTPENAEFIALYQAIIEGGLEGNGKTSESAAKVSQLADDVLSTHQSLAQSVLAVYKSADYVRHGMPIRTNLKYNTILPDFDLAPNPASNMVKILFRNPITEKCHLQICHLNGRFVKNVEVSANSTALHLNIENLATGIYFCRLSTGTTTSKLVVIK
ncbi:MAG: T9SS type A sorting domain-containing protein [Sphingobacteriales bacterium]|nr:MAG: T9SS type A sorting domain-containing protein [Sphingobacteriales bacterium]